MRKNIFKSPDFVLRKICEENLLIPIKDIMDKNYILRLNKVGVYIWEIMDHVKSIDEINDLLKRKYGSEYDLEKDIEKFLQKLEKLGLLRIENSI